MKSIHDLTQEEVLVLTDEQALFGVHELQEKQCV